LIYIIIGLSCYANDHHRSATEWDHDITKLQHRQDKRDELTDSESDTEDGYGDYKPSMERVRMLLKPPPPRIIEPVVDNSKGKKSTNKGKDASSSPPPKAANNSTTANNKIPQAVVNLDTTLDTYSVLGRWVSSVDIIIVMTF